jgi:tRNA 2-thiouridine synthesizing protein B
MGILFIVNRAPALASCLGVAAPSDTVLLIEDGVFAATAAPAFSGNLVALEPDVRARGLAARVAHDVCVVDDTGFVELVTTHEPIVTWR